MTIEVRGGSKRDISECPTNFRFTPERGNRHVRAFELYLLCIVLPSRGLGTSRNPRMERLSCIECDWTAEDVVDRVLTLGSAGGAGFCGGSGIRAPAATGSSSRG